MYLKDAQGDWITQPAGMVPSRRGWATGLIGPSTSYRMPPLTGCGSCGGMGDEWTSEPLPGIDTTDTTTPTDVDEPDRDIPMDTTSITAAEREASRVPAGGGSGSGVLIALGLGAVALWMLFGRKGTRRNPCHRRRNAPPRGRGSRRTCPSCGGAALIQDLDQLRPCSRCHGKGYVNQLRRRRRR